MISKAYRLMRSLRRKLGKPATYWTKFPNVIHIGTNNFCGYEHCGLHCIYCEPQWKIAQGKDTFSEMPMKWISWIINEVARDGRSLGRFELFWSGDALTEKRLPVISTMCKRYCSWAYTETFTCGTLTENTELLIDKNLDIISFTISAHTPKLYKKVHRSDLFENAIHTLEMVLDKKYPSQRVEVHCVLNKYNFDYLDQWWDFFGQYDGLKRVVSPLVASSDNVSSRVAMGNLTLTQQEKEILRVAGIEGRMWTRALIPDEKPCVVYDDLTIDSKGRILQCCNWYPSEIWNYGTIQQLIDEGRHLKDVWMEKIANRLRNPVCRSCNMLHPNWKQRLQNIKLEAHV